MSFPTFIADDISDKVYWSIVGVLPQDAAREVARNIASHVRQEVEHAIAEYHGEQQNRMAEDAVSERRAG